MSQISPAKLVGSPNSRAPEGQHVHNPVSTSCCCFFFDFVLLKFPILSLPLSLEPCWNPYRTGMADCIHSCFPPEAVKNIHNGDDTFASPVCHVQPPLPLLRIPNQLLHYLFSLSLKLYISYDSLKCNFAAAVTLQSNKSLQLCKYLLPSLWLTAPVALCLSCSVAFTINGLLLILMYNQSDRAVGGTLSETTELWL